jgi:cell division transport system ATP-binding protein
MATTQLPAPPAATPHQQEQALLVELAGVTLRHREGNLALVDVSLQVRHGEFVFLVGPTGSGKSSLLRLLNRELRPTTGSVRVEGRELASLPNREVPALRRRQGFVFQDFRLLPDRTLEENVAFALRVIGVHGREVRERSLEALRWVGLAGKGGMYPHQVSGGEQQRAAVARAVVNAPTLLLADEPTGNLDPETSREIVDLLDRVNHTGATVLVATHDNQIVDRMRRRVVELHAGRIIRDETRGRYESLLPPFR